MASETRTAAHMGRHHLEELVRILPAGAAMLDTEFRYLVASQRWITSYELPADIIGCPVEQFTDLSEEWKDFMRRGLEGETNFRDCDPYPRRNGRLEYVKWHVGPWYTEEGDIGGIVIFSDLITDQVSTQTQLAEHEANLASLFEHSPIGLNLCQMDGLWLQSNQAFLDIIGYSAEEADGGLTYWALTPRKYDEEEAEQLASLTESKRYGPYEKEFIHKDGHMVPVRLNGFLVERDGEQFIWSMIEDITEFKRLEEALERERLSAIQAAKLATLGEMAAGVAHELNNPLAVIQGFTDILSLSRDKDKVGDELLQEAVASINAAVQRSAHIISGLLRFSRQPGHDKKELFTAQTLIDDALILTRTRMKNHGIDLQVEVRSALRTSCNGIDFSQVLINLFHNAFDATKDQEERWLRVRATDIDDKTIEFRIIDSGPGIDEAVAESIFTPFFTTKAVGSGTGLGLSISKGIIEGLGGTLELDPAAPNTEFVIRMPASP